MCARCLEDFLHNCELQLDEDVSIPGQLLVGTLLQLRLMGWEPMPQVTEQGPVVTQLVQTPSEVKKDEIVLQNNFVNTIYPSIQFRHSVLQ